MGLLRTDESQGLYLVDGQTGELTPVATDEIAPWPHISKDGRFVAYSQGVKPSTLEDGLGKLPAPQVKMIKHHASKMRQKVLAGLFPSHDFAGLSDEAFDYAGPYRNWVIRYMCEHADGQLGEKIGMDNLQKARQIELMLTKLILVGRQNLDRKQVIVTSAVPILRPRFSPNHKCVAFVTMAQDTPERIDLFVASRQEKIPMMRVATGVSLGFDWRADSRAIVYIKQDGDATLASLHEGIIADENGRLLAEPVDDSDEGSAQTHNCTRDAQQLVGTFFEPMLSAKYGPGGRIFFSSASGSIPASGIDEPRYSLFCYDPVTGTVSNVLPPALADLAGQHVDFFALSPDGKRVLLPLPHHRFAIYTLGETDANIPIPEEDGAQEEMPSMLPAFKGNSQITCVISKNSRLLETLDEQARLRNQIVVMNADGDVLRIEVLSKNWPDLAIP